MRLWSTIVSVGAEGRMASVVAGERVFSIQEAAENVGISKTTLHRWLRRGKVPEPRRDRNGWRIFTAQEVEAIRLCVEETKRAPS